MNIINENEQKIKTMSVPLRKVNSVLQAGLLAIQKVPEWGNRTGQSYRIRSAAY